MAAADLDRLSQLTSAEIISLCETLAARILKYPQHEKIPVSGLGDLALVLLFGYTEYEFPFDYDVNDDDDKNNYTVHWWKE